MSSNKLLTESTVRRFMKLANVNSLTDNFISEMYQGADDDKEETAGNTKPPKPPKSAVKEEEVKETEETLEEEQDEETLEEQMEDEEEPPAGDEDMEMDMDMEMDDEPDDMDDEPELGAADISLTEEEAQLLIDLGERLKEAMGDEEPDMEDDDLDMEDEGPGLEDEGPEQEEEEPGMADTMRQGAGGVYENQDEIVQEVLRRVTKRIVAQKLKNTK